MDYIDILKIAAPTIAIIGGSFAIYRQLSKQHEDHKASLAKSDANLAQWRKEHREDVKEHRAEVSQALQTIAAHAVQIRSLEEIKK